MTDRLIDFDAARAEQTAEPIELRAFGRTFALPAALPASIMLDALRMQQARGADSALEAADILRLLERLLPAEVLDEVADNQAVTTSDLDLLLKMVLEAYGLGEAEDPPPNRATRRAGRVSRAPSNLSR